MHINCRLIEWVLKMWSIKLWSMDQMEFAKSMVGVSKSVVKIFTNITCSSTNSNHGCISHRFGDQPTWRLNWLMPVTPSGASATDHSSSSSSVLYCHLHLPSLPMQMPKIVVFRPHRMHEMLTILTDVHRLSVMWLKSVAACSVYAVCYVFGVTRCRLHQMPLASCSLSYSHLIAGFVSWCIGARQKQMGECESWRTIKNKP